jgi:hypothetical protein
MRDHSAFDAGAFVDAVIESAVSFKVLELMNERRNEICATFSANFREKMRSFQPACFKQFASCEWETQFFSQLEEVDKIISGMSEADAQIAPSSFNVLETQLNALEEISKKTIENDLTPVFFRMLHEDYVRAFPEASFKLLSECLGKLELFYRPSYVVEPGSPQVAIDLQKHLRCIDGLFEEYHREDVSTQRRAELKELLSSQKHWMESALTQVKLMCKEAAQSIEKKSSPIHYDPKTHQSARQNPKSIALFLHWYSSTIGPRPKSPRMFNQLLSKQAADSADNAVAACAPGH